MSFGVHKTVLLEEAIQMLVGRPDGVYVDGTFGRGGHTKLLLERLDADGRVFGFDKDPEAIAVADALQVADKRFTGIHAAFVSMKEALAEHGVTQVEGVLLDLGFHPLS